jgi:hypothetical protein
MSTDLENLTANLGLMRREFRDVHANHRLAVVSPPANSTAANRATKPAGRGRACGSISRRTWWSRRDAIAPVFRPRHRPGALDRTKSRDRAGTDHGRRLGGRTRRGRGGRHRHQSVASKRAGANCAPRAARIMRLSTAQSRACWCIRRRRAAALSPRAVLSHRGVDHRGAGFETGGRLDEAQAAMRDHLERCDFAYLVTDNVDEAIAWLKDAGILRGGFTVQ